MKNELIRLKMQNIVTEKRKDQRNKCGLLKHEDWFSKIIKDTINDDLNQLDKLEALEKSPGLEKLSPIKKSLRSISS